MEIWSWFWLSKTEPSLQENIWLNIVGWIVYSLALLVIIIVAVWQIFSQVDYNLAQVSKVKINFSARFYILCLSK